MTFVLRAATAAVALLAATAVQAENKPAQATKPAAAPAKPAAAAAAPGGNSPRLLADSKDWKAVAAAVGSGKLCYALSKAQKMEPPSLNHGDVTFFVTSRTADNVRNEPSLQVGYPLKENAKVVVDIDGKKFGFFSKGDGAWLEQNSDFTPFMDALRKGTKLSIAATSGRGNPTSYVFSLSGISGALEAVSKECK